MVSRRINAGKAAEQVWEGIAHSERRQNTEVGSEDGVGFSVKDSGQGSRNIYEIKRTQLSYFTCRK
jgi:hypothetical protein